MKNLYARISPSFQENDAIQKYGLAMPRAPPATCHGIRTQGMLSFLSLVFMPLVFNARTCTDIGRAALT